MAMLVLKEYRGGTYDTVGQYLNTEFHIIIDVSRPYNTEEIMKFDCSTIKLSITEFHFIIDVSKPYSAEENMKLDCSMKYMFGRTRGVNF